MVLDGVLVVEDNKIISILLMSEVISFFLAVELGVFTLGTSVICLSALCSLVVQMN